MKLSPVFSVFSLARGVLKCGCSDLEVVLAVLGGVNQVIQLLVSSANPTANHGKLTS